MKKITVIGGGLSGLVAAIRLVRAQIPVRLFEKKIIRFIASAESISPMKPYLT
ncbi:MAG: NAD(P)-binding protein [Cyclobacteriaceae bacterium]|nr:NAD(P)-binding protein [Cyclobacteriaceae bacterium]